MDVLDLFSGTGGFSLGLERAGFRTRAFCEADPFCREWLGQQWPGVPIYPDIRALDGRAIGFLDVVCGGFPCQDVSAAGKGEGLDGARSGLWFEMLRVVREVWPTWVVAENVPALRTRGADRVLGDLEESGYAAWPFVVGARHVGAPHKRDRAWIIGRRLGDVVANTDGDVLRILEQRLPGGWPGGIRDEGESVARNDGEGLADPSRHGDDGRPARERTLASDSSERGTVGVGTVGETRGPLADSDGGRREGERVENDRGLGGASGNFADRRGGARPIYQGQGEPPGMGDAGSARSSARLSTPAGRDGERAESTIVDDQRIRRRWPAGPGERQYEWEAPRTVTLAQCRLGVSVDGLPRGMGKALNDARLKAAGNAIVPEIAEIIGCVIVQIERELRR